MVILFGNTARHGTRISQLKIEPLVLKFAGASGIRIGMGFMDYIHNEICRIFSLVETARVDNYRRMVEEKMEENRETAAFLSARNITPEEMEKRQSEMAPLMVNRGMYSRAGMMNANRADIMDRIISAAARLARETGRAPSAVYLGESEMRELRALCERMKAMVGPAGNADEKVCGYDLVRVKKESYFAVH